MFQDLIEGDSERLRETTRYLALCVLVAAGGVLKPPMWRLSNSAWVRSLNWVTPSVQEDPLRLCSSYFARFEEKISRRLVYSFLVSRY